jgi:tellurite methyltransferase
VEDLATAHQAWDKRWQVPEQRTRWEEPEPFVQAILPLLRERNATRVLDIGCGIGRHAVYFAQQGLEATGIDASPTALELARQRAASANVSVDVLSGVFYDLRFDPNSFDAAIAWNVIYHGDGDIAQQAIDQIGNVLTPKGLFVGTMLSKRNAHFGRGHEVRPDTFVVDNAVGDEGHPHFFADAATVLRLHRGFEVLTLRDRDHGRGAWHWEFVFEKTS